MNKTDLVKRWSTDTGEKILSQAISCLVKGKSLEMVAGIEKYAGRWDLRGAPLSKLSSSRKVEAGGHGFTQNIGSLYIKKVLITSVDFSFADISYSWWRKCTVNNCLFHEVKAKELRVTATDFTNCIFNKADFSYSFLNTNAGASAGSFKNVDFIETNFNECVFSFLLMEGCLFDNCKLTATNFDVSRLKNVIFKGDVDSPWFRGFSKDSIPAIRRIFNRISPKDYPNTMENVDFSQAKLMGITFTNGVDLSKCIFPDDGNYLLFPDSQAVYASVRALVDSEWQGEDQRIALGMIDHLYLTKNGISQSDGFIDKHIYIEQFGESFTERFFALLRSKI